MLHTSTLMDRPIHKEEPFGLAEAGLDPFTLFDRWFNQAMAADPHNAAVVALATCSTTGRPSARMVLLKQHGVAGFVFHTNYQSRKASELSENPAAAMTFWWPAQERQVRLEGRVEPLTPAESDAYFACRPRESQLSAWASPQSNVIQQPVSMEPLRQRFDAAPVPRPANWGGFQLLPDVFEFWQGRANRLHDRIRFIKAGNIWQTDRLAP